MTRFALLLLFGVAATLHGADTLPPAPRTYFNDYAGLVSKATAQQLERTLENFERAHSSQIVVAIFPRIPSNYTLEDFTIRVATAWRPGQTNKDNGAILFIFRDDRKVRIEVGYGLEGAIPDAIAKRIIEEQITPAFRRGDFDAGVRAGVAALLQAARGEYEGTGRTVADRRKGRGGSLLPIILILAFIIFITPFARRFRRGTVYHRRRRSYWGGWSSGGWSSGGWGSSGGGSGWSGGGGFSGGGGRFGGGGASGSW